jgi:thiaminase
MLNTLASKAPKRRHASMFTKAALGVYEEEMQLHAKLLQDWAVSEIDTMVEMSPACLLYTSYLTSVVIGQPFHEGAALITA